MPGFAKRSNRRRGRGNWNPTLLRALATPNGGESVDLAEVTISKWATARPGVGQLDVTTSERKDMVLAIFKFDSDDRLTMCTREGPDGKRPTEFSGGQGTGQTLVVLERVKPGEVARNKEGGDKEREAADR